MSSEPLLMWTALTAMTSYLAAVITFSFHSKAWNAVHSAPLQTHPRVPHHVFPLIFHNTAQTCFNSVSAVPPDSSSSELANVPSDDNEQRQLNLNSESKGLPGGADKHAGRVVLCPAEIKKKNCLLFV